MVASPLSSASCFTSSTRTGMPALAKHMAMPPPMVPAPITAAERIGRAGVSSGTSGTLEAARSAKNTWRRALDSGELINSMNSLRSTCTPSSNVSSDAATASTHLSGAGYPFATAATLLRANCRKASGSGCATARSRRMGKGRRDAARVANSTAPASRSPSITSSKTPVLESIAAGTEAPETIRLSAVSRPTARGSSCVPPAPGRRPSFTSGSAICVEGVATR